jgi:hypothetical protein
LTVKDLHANLYKKSEDDWYKLNAIVDDKVDKTKLPVLTKQILVTNEGYIRILHILRMPVLGIDGKNLAIFSYADDRTSQCDLFDLFSLYKNHCLTKNQAILQFLNYLKIDSYFTELPTCMELKALLALSIDSEHKHAAEILDIELGTIAKYSSTLRQKCKEKTDLHLVLRTIRERQNTCSIKDWLDFQSF